MSNPGLIILVDADVISHFIAAGELIELPNILRPHTVTVLDTVYDEIKRINSRRQYLDQVIHHFKTIKIIPFPLQNLDIKKEYARIKKDNPLIGDGERACMAVAKYQKDVIASSNFRDIVPYCKANQIRYLGTLDILCIALQKQIFDIDRCNLFIATTRKINSARYPKHINSILDYQPENITFI